MTKSAVRIRHHRLLCSLCVLVLPLLLSCGDDDSTTSPSAEPKPLGIVFDGQAGGCGTAESDSYTIYRYDSSASAAIVVRLAPGELEEGWQLLTGGASAVLFDLPDSTYFCDDVGSATQIIDQWDAVSGSTWVWLGPVAEPGSEIRDVEVLLGDVLFEHGENCEQRSLRSLEIGRVTVGWLPG